MIRSMVLALGAGALLAAAAPAQSLTSVRGPGYPVAPVDARTAIMGGLGIGLQGLSGSLLNPAAVSHATRRGAIVSLETVDRTIEFAGASDEVGTTRFPLIQVVFPAGPAVFTAGYGGYLDQGWGLVREGEQLIGQETVAVTDVMRSEGGVGQFQLGAAVPLGERLGLGASVGLHMGSQRVVYERRFDPESMERLDPYTETFGWRYSGPVGRVGARWEPTDILRLSAAVTWAGTLVGEPTEGRAERREVDLPLQVSAGASGFLTPGLLAAVSGQWSGWSVTDPGAMGLATELPDASARDTWELGGGLEWASPRPAATRHYPVRVGFQYRQLPFPFLGEAPSEWYAGAGAGLRVGVNPRNPLAAVDLSVQRGMRTAPGAAGDLTESMWRFGLSVSLFGN
jgi:long-subunit fatty acid transport protein